MIARKSSPNRHRQGVLLRRVAASVWFSGVVCRLSQNGGSPTLGSRSSTMVSTGLVRGASARRGESPKGGRGPPRRTGGLPPQIQSILNGAVPRKEEAPSNDSVPERPRSDRSYPARARRDPHPIPRTHPALGGGRRASGPKFASGGVHEPRTSQRRCALAPVVLDPTRVAAADPRMLRGDSQVLH